ncbi:MAG: hypothetical protein AB7T06_00740 [Kofleriaceae bacterium]
MSYDEAAAALFQVPHGEFVAERKRLAAELKAAGDKMAASRLSRLQRPPVTAWAVNQLYWHARDAVDALFELAARLRAGDLSATTAHREALAKLRKRAEAMLSDAGHGTNEATLRRIALTLSAVAAAGTWMPDAPGMLSADRDPPGFDAVGVINAPAAPLPPKVEPVKYDFDAPISPIVVATAPPPAPAPAPKRNAIAELAAKRKEMAEEEKRRKAAERRGEEYVPPPAPAPAPAPPTVEPDKPDEPDEPDEDHDEADEVIEAPRPRTLSIVPPLPPDDSSEDEPEADEDEDDEDEADEAPTPPPPAPEAPKPSALEQLRARKKQLAEEAEEERRRKFIEDGGTREKVIAKRMMEAQERNRDASDAKRERVEAAVRAKLDAQRDSEEAKRVTASGDSGDTDDEDDTDEEDAAPPALTVERGGRPEGPSKGPPQATDLVNALAAKLGVTPKPTSDAQTTGGAPARPNLSTGASPARGTPASLSTGAPARTGNESPRPAIPKLSTGASPARHVSESTKPPGTFPRPRIPSAEALASSTPSSTSAKPAAMTDAERRKIDARAKLKAELEGRLRAANADVIAAEQRVEKLTAELAEADDALEAARAVVEDLRDKHDALD